MPCTKPPSIWPMSIAGFSERADIVQDVDAIDFISPVMVSTVTSVQAAP